MNRSTEPSSSVTRLIAASGRNFRPPAHWEQRVWSRLARATDADTDADDTRTTRRPATRVSRVSRVSRGLAWLGVMGAETLVALGLLVILVSAKQEIAEVHQDLFALDTREEIIVRALFDHHPNARWGVDGCVCPPRAPAATTCEGSGEPWCGL